MCALAAVLTASAAIHAGAAGPEVVARVGPHVVDADELQGAVRALFGDAARTPPSAEQRQAALQALIASRLLAMEAEARGLHQTPQVRGFVDSLEQALLVERIHEREMPQARPPSEAAVDSLYAEWGHGEQVLVPHILLRTRPEAEQVLRQLQSGADFDSLARARSAHTMSAMQGGSMGFLRRGQLPAAIAEAVWHAPVGQLHPQPLQSPLGWHVVRVADRRTLTREAQRASIQSELRRRERERVERVFRRQLAAEYGLVYEARTAAAVASLRDTIAGDRALFHWRGGQLDLAGFLRRAPVPDPVTADTSRMRRIAEDLVYRDLAVQAARDRGDDRDPDLRQRLDRARLQRLSEALFDQVNAEGFTDEQLRAHYERHRQRYRAPTRITIREILVDEPALADSLYGLLRAGHDLADLARRFTVRTDLRQTAGLWPDVNRGDPRSAKIYRIAKDGDLGLRPPLKVPGGTSVFEVLEREPGRLLTLAECGETVRQELASQAMEDLIADLRQRFADRIEVRGR